MQFQGSHFPLTGPLFPNGFLGGVNSGQKVITKISSVSSPNSSPAPTHHSPPCQFNTLSIQEQTVLKSKAAFLLFNTVIKTTSVQSWPPLKKHLHNKSPFFYLKILFISLKRHLISQTKRASGYLAFTLANRLLFLSLFSEMFYPSKRIFSW